MCVDLSATLLVKTDSELDLIHRPQFANLCYKI